MTDLVLLVDADPPSPIGGGRAFYPAGDGPTPVDARVMVPRLETALRLVEEAGSGVVTLHTSPRHRADLFAEPYAGLWRAFVAAGATLALHPHEDRADGGSLFRAPGHLEGVLAGRLAHAAALGLPVTAFRAGLFASRRDLGPLLARHGITADLSALPGAVVPEKAIAWPAVATAFPLPADLDAPDGATTGVLEIPIGWRGAGTDLGADYLFNERLDLDGLIRVWDGVPAAACVNFLCHGFGLAEPRWRDQARRFLDHARTRGAALVSPDAARARHLPPPVLGAA